MSITASRVNKAFLNPSLALQYAHQRVRADYITRFKATHLYERDWDVAAILDTCSYDLAASTDADYPGPLDSIYSVASITGGWMQRTFDGHGEDTVYVTGAPYSQQMLDPADFAELDEVWRYAFDDDLGTVPPRPTTDRAITHARERDPDRLIVHYMQPHFPALDYPELGSKIDPDTAGWPASIWTRLKNGEVDADVVWGAYQSNLRRVMDELSILLENVDAEHLVVTSDHGNGFGEAGIYGHPRHAYTDTVRRVPWIEVGETTDRGTHSPRGVPDERERVGRGQTERPRVRVMVPKISEWRPRVGPLTPTYTDSFLPTLAAANDSTVPETYVGRD